MWGKGRKKCWLITGLDVTEESGSTLWNCSCLYTAYSQYKYFLFTYFKQIKYDFLISLHLL